MTDAPVAPAAWVLADEQDPTEPGWYPSLICFDPAEGALPSAHQWTGSVWADQPLEPKPSRFLPVVCATEETAMEMAYEHDPDA